MFKKLFSKKKKKLEEEQIVEENLEKSIDVNDEDDGNDIKNTVIEENRFIKEKDEIEEIIEKKEEIEEIEEIEEEIEETKEAKEEIAEEPNEEKKTKKGFFQKLKEGLSKTRDDFSKKIEDVLIQYKKVDEDLFEELEEILITADLGYETTLKIIDKLRDTVKRKNIQDVKLIKTELENIMGSLLKTHESDQDYFLKQEETTILLVVGVNGVGKTTTIGKISNLLKKEGKKVIVAAADTFRAAAIEQLTEWTNRAEVELISQKEGSDPASVVFDAVQAAKARKADVLICDTAGRLHNKKNLMNELEKMNRIIEREYPEAKREVLLVLDATTGQNALLQAKTFNEVCDLTGLVLTKLDGTAKGGIVFAIEETLDLPIRFICVGEQIDDLEHFRSEEFVKAIFSGYSLEKE